jgi:hypothetical protein
MAAGLAAGVAAFAAGPALAQCASGPEAVALQMRTLQTRLMVAALTCDARADYNAFVGRFRPVLARNGRLLVSYFDRTHGRAGKQELNRFVTQLANAASAVSIEDRGAFCAEAEATFARLADMPAEALEAFAQLEDNGPDGMPALCEQRHSALAPVVR